MKDARDTKKRRSAATSAQPTTVVSDDPEVLAQQAREAIEKSAAERPNPRYMASPPKRAVGRL